MFNCPHTGVALAALKKLRAQQVIAPRTNCGYQHGSRLQFTQQGCDDEKKLKGLSPSTPTRRDRG